MIKIGTLEIDEKVYLSSDSKTYNFEFSGSGDEFLEAWRSATEIEFDFGTSEIKLYQPDMRAFQYNALTERYTVVFGANTINSDIADELAESVSDDENAIVDLGDWIAELEARVEALEPKEEA